MSQSDERGAGSGGQPQPLLSGPNEDLDALVAALLDANDPRQLDLLRSASGHANPTRRRRVMDRLIALLDAPQQGVRKAAYDALHAFGWPGARRYGWRREQPPDQA